MKRLVIGALLIAAVLISMGAGGGFARLSAAFSDWLDGRSVAREASQQPSAATTGAQISPRALGALPSPLPGSTARGGIDALNNDPSAQLALWQSRLERATEVYDTYRQHTKYPFDSRPARDHPDQMYPNQPVIEDRKLKEPGKNASQTVRLKTSQERVHVQGSETVLITVAAFDENNSPLPISFTRSVVYDPPREGKAPHRNPTTMTLNDEGLRGDLTKSDFVYSARVSPEELGYSRYHGLIRLEMNLTVNQQPGFLYFDIYYSPEPPALWSGAIREALERGSLNFYLPLEIKAEGRYVITGRIDDAKGQPFALISFNNELAKGAREVKLNLFGKLLVDEQPTFPLTLRDIDGFLLIPDADPDRALLQRRVGKQHVSRSYATNQFAEDEWDSEERQRYLAEYGKDVETARAHLDHIRRSMKP
jgi:hypothetical protein